MAFVNVPLPTTPSLSPSTFLCGSASATTIARKSWRVRVLPETKRHRPLCTASLSDSQSTPLLTPSPSALEEAPPTPPPSLPALEEPLLQCLRCKSPILDRDNILSGTGGGSLQIKCKNCGTTYPARSGYYDFTANPSQYLLPRLSTPQRQGLFQMPWVAYAYERGWRNLFKSAGFPGPDAEAEMAYNYLFPSSSSSSSSSPSSTSADVLLDISCATGIITRRLATLGQPNTQVLGIDISHAMLVEAVSRTNNSGLNIGYIRADVAKMPFATCSVDAINAGAALHCWPRLQDGLAEIYRILKPGSRFFATTFTMAASSQIRKLLNQLGASSASNSGIRTFEQKELEYILRAAGFTDVSVELQERCLIARCEK